MLEHVLRAFSITPDVDLGVMTADQSLAALTARLVAGIDEFLIKERPSLVLVQGDTTTSLCAALAAFYRRIPVGHVEAGLRTGKPASPFPEEANRTMTARLASLHFAPTERARANLLAESIPGDSIFLTGNTVVDALMFAVAENRRTPPASPLPSLFGDPTRQVVLVTGHRRESFGAGFEAICAGLRALAQRFPDVAFVYPVHLNPNVRAPVFRYLKGIANLHLIEPLDYLPFVELLSRCSVVLTDSGGVQEEAPSLGKPVLVMRDHTERPEAIEAGVAKLVGTSAASIEREVSRLLIDEQARAQLMSRPNPYGDGHAAERILDTCERFLLRA